MFLLLPMLAIISVYFLAAVLPAWFLMKYINKMDTVEKEPPQLLLSLVIMGVLAALIASAAERIGTALLAISLDPQSKAFIIVLAFLVVAVVEEGAKFLLLKRKTWLDPNFNFRFDGIVYAVFVSLGFAAFENLLYVAGYGLSAAIPRAVLAVPGHMGFAVFMGIFYGRAKQCENRGDFDGKRRNFITGYLMSVFLHGFYDACAMIGSVLSTLLFILFVVAMYIIVIRLIKRESANDEPVL